MYRAFAYGSFALLFACSSQAPQQSSSVEVGSGGLDRSILPIVPPVAPKITELDARNATAPDRFTVEAPEGAPNVVIILIDDIGFGAVDTFGGGIRTPTLTRLADGGLRFNQFHTTALCSPTRAALKSGRNHHNTNVGSVQEVATAFPGNQGQIPLDAVPLAEILRQNGYSTGAFGKWHETAPWEVSVSGPYDRWPTHQGFDKFYGFIGGETNQWDPLIFDGQTRIDPPEEEGYHFTTDMTDQAIDWMRFQKAMTPEKPFMVYYATGAVHAPHHVGKEWIEEYKGEFDEGFGAYRQATLERQKKMGIVPEDTVLPPVPEDLPVWEESSEDARRLYARQMEVFAAFMTQTDHEIGRMIDAIDDLGQLDNTIVVYILGDNGSSAEGGLSGTFNELVSLNGIFGVETVESMLARIDEWGSPESYPHMTAAWTVATDTPFRWSKQVASDYGGTRNPLVVHWPDGFEAKGEVRSQWHHVVDIAPTILEAAGIPAPSSVNGVKQKPMDGVSMLYAAKDGAAADRHTTQYFEMFGNRAIYNDGWLARVIHKAPWRGQVEHSLQEDVWELYDTRSDFALAKDLAAEKPEKLAELQKLFDEEAIRNSVYPIDDRTYERFNAAIAGRPDLMAGREELVLSKGMIAILENTFINVKNTSHSIEAKVDTTKGGDGVLLAQGGKFAGWALHMQGGKPTYTYNWFGLELYEVQVPKALPAGQHTIVFDFTYDGEGAGKGGKARISVDGTLLAEGRIDKTVPFVFAADEGADVGIDLLTQVSPVYPSASSSAFSGDIETITVRLKK